MGATVVLAALVAAAEVTVEGNVTCPTPAEVEARLAPLLAAAPGSSAGDGRVQVRLARDGTALHVSLVAADGRLLAFRTLTGTHACDALAEAAAVIVAAWRSDVGGRPMLAAGADAGAEPRAAELRAWAPQAGRAAPAWGIGVAAGVSLAGDRPRPAAALSLGYQPSPARPWSARLGLAYLGPLDRELSAGRVRWQRGVLELGPQLGGGAGHLGWRMHLGAAAALTRLEGRGLAQTQAHDDFALGFGGGARLGTAGTGLRPFVELAARVFPTRIVALADEGEAQREATLPRLEAMLAVGAAFGN
jgi:hypothetical protein